MTPHQCAILAKIRAILRGDERGSKRLWTQIRRLSPIARARMAAALLAEGGHPWDRVARRLQYESADEMVNAVLEYPRLAMVAGAGGRMDPAGGASPGEAERDAASLPVAPTDRRIP